MFHSDGTLLNPAHSFKVQGQLWLGSYCYNLNKSEYSVKERVQTTFSSDKSDPERQLVLQHIWAQCDAQRGDILHTYSEKWSIFLSITES